MSTTPTPTYETLPVDTDGQITVPLTCGHSGKVFHASSFWDFPDETVYCSTCDVGRNLDPEFRARLVDTDELDTRFADDTDDGDEGMTTESEFVETLTEALATLDEDGDTFDRVDTFESAGLLSGNEGLVVRLADGSEFQITVVRSR